MNKANPIIMYEILLISSFLYHESISSNNQVSYIVRLSRIIFR